MTEKNLFSRFLSRVRSRSHDNSLAKIAPEPVQSERSPAKLVSSPPVASPKVASPKVTSPKVTSPPVSSPPTTDTLSPITTDTSTDSGVSRQSTSPQSVLKKTGTTRRRTQSRARFGHAIHLEFDKDDAPGEMIFKAISRRKQRESVPSGGKRNRSRRNRSRRNKLHKK